MAICVYSGAQVFLEDYTATVLCDIFEIAGSVAIYTDCPWEYLRALDPKVRDMKIASATHQLCISPRGHVSNDKRFIFVPSAQLKGPRR